MKCLIILIGLVLVGNHSILGQPITLINQPNNYFRANSYGQIFLVNGSELFKYDTSGNPVQRYGNNKLGAISNIDAANPLKILLFYRESNAVVFLDQMLIEITGALDIYEMAGFEASLACSSSDGGFWLWNPVQQIVNHYTDQRVSDRQTQCLSDWLTGNAVTEILESGQKLFVVASNKILVFDYFGTYLNSLAFEQVKDLSLSNQSLVWFNGSIIETYHLQSHQTDKIPIPDGKKSRQAIIVGDKLILGFEKSVEIYNLK